MFHYKTKGINLNTPHPILISGKALANNNEGTHIKSGRLQTINCMIKAKKITGRQKVGGGGRSPLQFHTMTAYCTDIVNLCRTMGGMREINFELQIRIRKIQFIKETDKETRYNTLQAT